MKINIPNDFKEKANKKFQKLKTTTGRAIYISSIILTFALTPGCNKKEESSPSIFEQQYITQTLSENNLHEMTLTTKKDKNYNLRLKIDNQLGIYYQIITPEEKTLNNEKFTNFINIDNNYTALLSAYNRQNWFILNRTSGKIKDLPNVKDIVLLGNFPYFSAICKENTELFYRLLKSDGTKINNSKYQTICSDEKSGRIYLGVNNDKELYTDIFDIETNTIIKRLNNIEVRYAYNYCYTGKENTKKAGLYYLKDINSEPTLAMPKAFLSLKLLKNEDYIIARNEDPYCITINSKKEIHQVINKDFSRIVDYINNYTTNKNSKNKSNYIIAEDLYYDQYIISDDLKTIKKINLITAGGTYIDTIIDDKLLITDEIIHKSVYSLDQGKRIIDKQNEIIPYYDNNELKLLCLDEENNPTIYDCKQLIKENKNYKKLIKEYFIPKKNN